MSVSEFANRVIEQTFYVLFFLVPLIWLPVTSELFEFNKMILVYLGTSVVLTVWALKSVEERKVTFKRTPLDIPILLFLVVNILSTLFSIDRHTSIFGYYSRLNGGLLSTFSYIILFYAFVTFFDRERLVKSLKVLMASSAIVAIYGILQHPTPLFRDPDGAFRGIDAGYWQQNAQARVFSTFGHPNWLAAFFLMLTPFAFFLLSITKKLWEKSAYTTLLIIYFLSFTFTYSRGGTLGFVAAMTILALGILVFILSKRPKSRVSISLNTLKPPNLGFFLLVILASWVLIFVFFGNAFTSRGVNLASLSAQTDTQLASYGSETGRIRLIVWRGGLDIFKNFPILGSGVETFAYSYYLFRPVEHNLTGEWDFLYNKAHNEFVNYLSTTGIPGFTSYILIISTFVLYLLRKMRFSGGKSVNIFYLTALASYAGYHVQNLFGFSVVFIALLFFLIPGFAFVFSGDLRELKLNLNYLKRSLLQNTSRIAVFFLGTLLILGALNIWIADYYYATGISTTDLQKSYQDLKFAVYLRPDEPLYKAALGLTTVSIGATSQSKERVEEGFAYLNQATNNSPNNTTIVQTRMEAIYGLAVVDEKYTPQAIETAEVLANLAPTAAKMQYNLAVMYVQAKDLKKAQAQLEKTVGLKFNYKQAWNLLLKVDNQLNDKESLDNHKKEYELIFQND